MKKSLENGKCVVLEVLTPRGTNLKKFFDFTEKAWQTGIDAFTVTDMPMGRVRMAPWAVSHLLIESGKEVLMHFTRNTRNMIRIQSDLLGCHALGINNLLLLSGDNPVHGDYPKTTSVNDIDILDLIRLTKLLNEGKDLAGNKMNGKTNFFVGGALNPFSNKDIERAKQKIEAGIDFLVTQPLFQGNVARTLKDKLNTKILASIVFFESVKQVGYFSGVPGIEIPKEIIDSSEKGDEYVKEKSFEAVLKFVEETKNVIDGFYIVAIVKDLEKIRKVVEIAKN
ncbi:methylenetetrahydrofolate reductase [Thermotoga sp. KOL6]|uniref:methylenetetrahydrofolate reductase n=1 Tax=Thermotoga sp. KOL6 TaxID=126741 RepID=UPI000C788C23|nr:methylenetetrahydrofolate reductase [Thermotoga sp. KOL6]PLV59024.1 methylenetetrahydrofolate reductase [Thermotoga sp. KOL6]